MRQLSEHELNVRPSSTGSEFEMPQCQLVLNGSDTGKHLPGVDLEAAFEWCGKYLLFLTSDIPQEEMLDVFLLNEKLEILDNVTIGGMYSTGIFSLLESTRGNIVRFRFIGDTDWKIELLETPGFALPFVSEPKGVRRTFGFSRHFIVRGA